MKANMIDIIWKTLKDDIKASKYNPKFLSEEIGKTEGYISESSRKGRRISVPDLKHIALLLGTDYTKYINQDKAEIEKEAKEDNTDIREIVKAVEYQNSSIEKIGNLVATMNARLDTIERNTERAPSSKSLDTIYEFVKCRFDDVVAGIETVDNRDIKISNRTINIDKNIKTLMEAIEELTKRKSVEADPLEVAEAVVASLFQEGVTEYAEGAIMEFAKAHGIDSETLKLVKSNYNTVKRKIKNSVYTFWQKVGE